MTNVFCKARNSARVCGESCNYTRRERNLIPPNLSIHSHQQYQGNWRKKSCHPTAVKLAAHQACCTAESGWTETLDNLLSMTSAREPSHSTHAPAMHGPKCISIHFMSNTSSHGQLAPLPARPTAKQGQ